MFTGYLKIWVFWWENRIIVISNQQFKIKEKKISGLKTTHLLYFIKRRTIFWQNHCKKSWFNYGRYQ